MRASRGFTHSVFLLARAARIKPRVSVDGWIEAARLSGSYFASALDLYGPAHYMLRVGLASWSEGVLIPAAKLAYLSEVADGRTLRRIAQILISVDPPAWLQISVNSGEVARELIPSDDLVALGWLDPWLDEILIDVCDELFRERRANFEKAIGDAGELLVFSALKAAGRRPVYVAELSDGYGYDVEVVEPRLARIEVKSTGVAGKGSFYLSRNEYEKSRQYGEEWLLWQVVFVGAAFVADVLDSSHVEGVYELTSRDMSRVVPRDRPEFVWTESAVVTPDGGSWRRLDITLDADFRIPGFVSLQEELGNSRSG